MTIKHKCEGKIVHNSAQVKTERRSSYHENFHSDESPWHYWIETTYHVDKCENCSKSHIIKQSEVL